MLEVKVDIIPYGMEEFRENLDTIYIGNDGTGDREVGNYDVYTSDPRNEPLEDKSLRSTRDGWVGRIEGFPRKGGRTALAAQALELTVAANPSKPR